MKIEEIKTIVTDNPDTFDMRVNNLLKEGYTLTRRGPEQVGPDAWKLYAELVKLEEDYMDTLEAEPITWQEAVEVLRDTCVSAKGCDDGDCPMYAWCQENIPEVVPAPKYWTDPE